MEPLVPGHFSAIHTAIYGFVLGDKWQTIQQSFDMLGLQTNGIDNLEEEENMNNYRLQ